MKNRIDQMEYTVMELGTEMYRLKKEVASVKELQDKFATAIGRIKSVLDEKGLVTEDDFDSALDMADLLEPADMIETDPIMQPDEDKSGGLH